MQTEGKHVLPLEVGFSAFKIFENDCEFRAYISATTTTLSQLSSMLADL